MVVSIRHKGLKLFWERGDVSKLPAEHIEKIRNILTRLNRSTNPQLMNQPGLGLHPLTGDLKGYWAVKVDKNYRIIFRFIGEDVDDVDYLDYH